MNVKFFRREVQTERLPIRLPLRRRSRMPKMSLALTCSQTLNNRNRTYVSTYGSWPPFIVSRVPSHLTGVMTVTEVLLGVRLGPTLWLCTVHAGQYRFVGAEAV